MIGLSTAEHELGHAIRLDSTLDGESVMQPAGSCYSIQDIDNGSSPTIIQRKISFLKILSKVLSLQRLRILMARLFLFNPVKIVK